MTAWLHIPIVALLGWLGPAPAQPASAPTANTEVAPSVGAEPEPGPSATASAVDQGPVTITTRIEPDPSNVGDLLELEVVAAYPRDVRVNLPSVLEFSPLHLVSVDASEPEVTGEGLRTTFTIRLQHFDVGEASVPAFSLTYVTGDGEVHTVDVPAQPFEVESLLANETDPQRKGEDPPISIEYPNELAETIAYSAAATLVVALLLWVIGRRLWGRPKPVYVPPPIPPHEVALQALSELEQSDLVEQERWAEYYLHLTEIAKGYVQGRFGFDALDRTTEEIRRDLVRDPERIAPLSVEDVVAFLQRCDLVKFARRRPEVDEARNELEHVRELVQQTTPQAPPPGGGKDEKGEDTHGGEDRQAEADKPEADASVPAQRSEAP